MPSPSLARCLAAGLVAACAASGSGRAAETGELLAKAEAAGGNCESLAKLRLVNVALVSANTVAAPFTPPGVTVPVTQPFCRVIGVASPTADSGINFEVWLPAAEAWNGKFYSGTGGGSTGTIQYPALAAGLAGRYAAMSQDRGHVSRADLGVPLSTDGSWAAGHPEKIIDWGYRSQHVTTLAGKAIAQAFYDRPAQHSYFVGCSAGGQISAMEASRFPDDYDGIVAGAPAWNWTNLMAGRLSAALPGLRDPAAAMSPDKLGLLNRAAVAACDKGDGLEDGLIADPRQCRFDPAVLQCREGDAADCLTPPQVAAAKTIYAGPHRPDGTPIFFGYPPGSEAFWTVDFGPAPGGSSFDYFRYWIREDAKYDSRTFDFGADVDAAANKRVAGETIASVVNAPPDLARFRARGGKLLMWHGWADEQVNTMGSIDYYDRVVAAGSKAEADQVLRLFLAPGVAHCGRGPGPDSFDVLAPLERWVEQGVAPEQITASKREPDGRVSRSRPLCAYPRVAKYKGNGDPNQAESFQCSDP